MAQVLIGLGGNMGDRAANFYAATRELLARGCDVIALSPLYETEPWGVTNQPRFLNAVCQVRTDLTAPALLDTLKEIERSLGRQETMHYGPRPIDLDILLYDDLFLDTPRLTIPHLGMVDRSTVLVPLADLAPNLRHPITGRTVKEHLADLGPTPDVAPYPPGLPARSDEK